MFEREYHADWLIQRDKFWKDWEKESKPTEDMSMDDKMKDFTEWFEKGFWGSVYRNYNIEMFDTREKTPEEWQTQKHNKWTKRRHLWLKFRKFLDRNYESNSQDDVIESDEENYRGRYIYFELFYFVLSTFSVC